MLGAKDRRVPPPDGLQYAAVLRKAGVDVRVIVFGEDGHALDRPQTEYEQWINVAWEAKKHLLQQ
jgi:acylaminoacyl-peptidase